jgi:hypothetical protein
MHACWEVANNITRFGRFDIDMGPQVYGDVCCVTHILMPVLIRCLLYAEWSGWPFTLNTLYYALDMKFPVHDEVSPDRG